jgi:hypothetical protein
VVNGSIFRIEGIINAINGPKMTDWPPVQANVFLKILYLLSLQSRGEVGRQTRHPGQAHTILKIVDVGANYLDQRGQARDPWQSGAPHRMSGL